MFGDKTMDSLLGGLMGQKHVAAETAAVQAVLANETDMPAATLDDTASHQVVKELPITVDSEAVEVVEKEMKGVEKFIIPTEDDDDLLGEDELDMDSEIGLRIRKPAGTEFFKMNPASLFAALMLTYKANPDAMDEATYWVAKSLRGKVGNDLRMVKYFPCHSCASKRLFIMPVKVSDTDWYRSLEVLFKQPREFFETHAVRIKAEKELGRYRIMFREDKEPVAWPGKTTAELVTDALGSANIIASSDHPIYQELVSGEELK